jgi:hypothetical protein
MKFSYQKLQGEQTFVTENYVSSPPALIVVNEKGEVFTLGFQRGQIFDGPRGEYCFDILKDGEPTGIIGSRIERRNGKIRVFTRGGWRIWNGREFT